MKDKNGFLIKCIYSKWKAIDDFANYEQVCEENGYICYADECCKRYEPERSDDGKRETD